MITFRFRRDDTYPMQGVPIYTRSEHSFRFEPIDRAAYNDRIAQAGVTSISVGRVQVELTIGDGTAFYIWGYQPVTRWLCGEAIPRDPRPGAVTVSDDDGDFISGVSIGLAEVGEWVTVYDESSGWIRVTPDLKSIDEQVVLIATDTCLGLIGDQLNSIWVRPTFEP